MPTTDQGCTKRQVWFFAPQIVGYVRLCLLCLGIAATPKLPLLTYLSFFTNFALDGLDGYLARRLGQVTRLGALVDVAIDIVSRGVLWAAALDGPWSAIPICLESLTFACTHTVASGAWKNDYFEDAPAWVSAVMSNGFKSPAGVLAIGGLMGLPLWMYARRFLASTALASPALGLPLILGRFLCATVECWVICRHMNALLEEDVASRGKRN